MQPSRWSWQEKVKRAGWACFKKNPPNSMPWNSQTVCTFFNWGKSCAFFDNVLSRHTVHSTFCRLIRQSCQSPRSAGMISWGWICSWTGLRTTETSELSDIWVDGKRSPEVEDHHPTQAESFSARSCPFCIHFVLWSRPRQAWAWKCPIARLGEIFATVT